MHVIQEMNLKLQDVEYVVFDEADRYEVALKGVAFYMLNHQTKRV